MRRRSGIFLLILAIVVAIVSIWFNNLWITYQQYYDIQADKSRLSYYFTEFSLQSTDAKGQPEYKLLGQHFSHWTGKDTSEIVKPILHAFDKQRQPTEIVANHAVMFHKDDHLELQGAAKITNTRSGSTTSLETENLRYHPKKRWIETDAQVIFTSGNSTIMGKGMDSQLDKNILRIHADVLSIFNENSN